MLLPFILSSCVYHCASDIQLHFIYSGGARDFIQFLLRKSAAVRRQDGTADASMSADEPGHAEVDRLEREEGQESRAGQPTARTSNEQDRETPAKLHTWESRALRQHADGRRPGPAPRGGTWDGLGWVPGVRGCTAERGWGPGVPADVHPVPGGAGSQSHRARARHVCLCAALDRSRKSSGSQTRWRSSSKAVKSWGCCEHAAEWCGVSSGGWRGGCGGAALFVGRGWEVGTYTSVCGHVMHSDCWQRFYDALLAKETHRGLRFRRPQTSYDETRGECHCPLCETISNTVLPLLPPLSRLVADPPNDTTAHLSLCDWLEGIESTVTQSHAAARGGRVGRWVWLVSVRAMSPVRGDTYDDGQRGAKLPGAVRLCVWLGRPGAFLRCSRRHVAEVRDRRLRHEPRGPAWRERSKGSSCCLDHVRLHGRVGGKLPAGRGGAGPRERGWGFVRSIAVASSGVHRGAGQASGCRGNDRHDDGCAAALCGVAVVVCVRGRPGGGGGGGWQETWQSACAVAWHVPCPCVSLPVPADAVRGGRGRVRGRWAGLPRGDRSAERRPRLAPGVLGAPGAVHRGCRPFGISRSHGRWRSRTRPYDGRWSLGEVRWGRRQDESGSHRVSPDLHRDSAQGRGSHRDRLAPRRSPATHLWGMSPFSPLRCTLLPLPDLGPSTPRALRGLRRRVPDPLPVPRSPGRSVRGSDRLGQTGASHRRLVRWCTNAGFPRWCERDDIGSSGEAAGGLQRADQRDVCFHVPPVSRGGWFQVPRPVPALRGDRLLPKLLLPDSAGRRRDGRRRDGTHQGVRRWHRDFPAGEGLPGIAAERGN